MLKSLPIALWVSLPSMPPLLINVQISTGLTQVSQAMARLHRAARQTTRRETWEHPGVSVAELNNLITIHA